LFRKYVSDDEETFAMELYMNLDQLKCMSHNGMFIGGHGYSHEWLSSLTAAQQEKEIDLTLRFLSEIYGSFENWVFCYPHGDFNDSLLDILRRRNCKLGFTIKSGKAKITGENALVLNRVDTNEFQRGWNFSPA